MKEKIILVIAIAILWSMPAGAAGQGDVAPSWQATNFQGESVSYPELASGKPTVIIFWASWCSYCKAFMPYLKGIQQEYGVEGVEIVAVNFREDEAEDGDPDAYIKDTGITLTAIRDGEDIAAAYGIRNVPGLMVVDSDGIISYRRGRTNLPAGQTIAELWDENVRTALDAEYMDGC